MSCVIDIVVDDEIFIRLSETKKVSTSENNGQWLKLYEFSAYDYPDVYQYPEYARKYANFKNSENKTLKLEYVTAIQDGSMWQWVFKLP
jgi:hypothetical protein